MGQKLQRMSRQGSSKLSKTQNAPTQDRLSELQEWYQRLTENPFSFDEPLSFYEDEVVDEDQIKHDINKLLPGITRDLRNGFCRPCQELADKLYDLQISRWEKNFHMSGIKELVAGKLAGCISCQFFLENLVSNTPYEPKGMDALIPLYKVENRLQLLGQSTNLVLADVTTGSKEPRFRIGYSKVLTSSLRSICGKLCLVDMDESAEFSSTLKFHMRENRDSLDTAKRWLSACTQSHHLCMNSKHLPLPTRLLHIHIKTPPSSGGPFEMNPSVRVVETASLDNSNILYATLSHCWGDFKFAQLTTETLDAYRIDIPWSLFTKTFQEAILTTHHLGLHYLWIDSFCIIQNSMQDWATEANLMASVYGGSHINIAAARAKDGREGLMLNNSLVTSGFNFSSSRVPNCSVVREFLYSEGISVTNLSSRAWCFQERLLSPRTLYFGCKDIFWECQMKSACDFFPNGIPAPLLFTKHQHPKKLLTKWEKIIELYSNCELTYQTDKLVALSAVARTAQEMSGDEYVAGMWRSALESYLLWQCESVFGPTEVSSGGAYRAPTWSWASADGPIIYDVSPEPQPELFANVLDVALTVRGLDPFGQLSDGVLTLECVAIISIQEIDRSGFLPILELDNARFPNTQVPDRQGSRKFLQNYYGRDEKYVKLVPILESRPGIHGLILKATNRHKGEFERIGKYSHYGPITDRRLKRSQKELRWVGETRNNVKTSKKTYIITIV